MATASPEVMAHGQLTAIEVTLTVRQVPWTRCMRYGWQYIILASYIVAIWNWKTFNGASRGKKDTRGMQSIKGLLAETKYAYAWKK